MSAVFVLSIAGLSIERGLAGWLIGREGRKREDEEHEEEEKEQGVRRARHTLAC